MRPNQPCGGLNQMKFNLLFLSIFYASTSMASAYIPDPNFDSGEFISSSIDVCSKEHSFYDKGGSDACFSHSDDGWRTHFVPVMTPYKETRRGLVLRDQYIKFPVYPPGKGPKEACYKIRTHCDRWNCHDTRIHCGRLNHYKDRSIKLKYKIKENISESEPLYFVVEMDYDSHETDFIDVDVTLFCRYKITNNVNSYYKFSEDIVMSKASVTLQGGQNYWHAVVSDYPGYAGKVSEIQYNFDKVVSDYPEYAGKVFLSDNRIDFRVINYHFVQGRENAKLFYEREIFFKITSRVDPDAHPTTYRPYDAKDPEYPCLFRAGSDDEICVEYPPMRGELLINYIQVANRLNELGGRGPRKRTK